MPHNIDRRSFVTSAAIATGLAALGRSGQLFASPSDALALPKFVMVGDSIVSIESGYAGTTITALKSVATGYFVRIPNESDRLWLEKNIRAQALVPYSPKIVYFNMGLDWVNYMDRMSSTQEATLWTTFTNSLGKIIDTCKAYVPKPIVLYGLSTPIDEPAIQCATATDCKRRASDVVTMNGKAKTVCSQKGVPVCDLYSFTKNKGLQTKIEDGVRDGRHYTPEGRALQGQYVADFIKSHLTTATTETMASSLNGSIGLRVRDDGERIAIALPAGAGSCRSVRWYGLDGSRSGVAKIENGIAHIDRKTLASGRYVIRAANADLAPMWFTVR